MLSSEMLINTNSNLEEATALISKAQRSLISQLSSALKITEIVSYILVQRGIKNEEEARAFLSPTLRNHLPDPAKLKNSIPAIKLICESIQQNKYITIYSDFDVDGMTSASQLWTILKHAGAKLRYYVPDRQKEGYGLSISAIEKLHQEKTQLLITLDCGITNIKEVERAKDLGLDVIIIDHHELGENSPPADYIINPMQEDCGFFGQKLCTAGIVWLLSIILLKEIKNLNIGDSSLQTSSKDLLDLAAIGTICDMVPLLGVNRLIASRGLDLIRENPRPGIKAIQEVAQLPSGSRFSCTSIAYGIGPRLNATGRLADATTGMTLLTSTDSSESKKLAEKINNLNLERKSHEDHAREQCLDIASKFEAEIGEKPFAYTLYDSSFHVGVIGIAAQRMVEALKKPVAVLGKPQVNEKSDIIKGSVRSIGGFHVAGCLKNLSHYLVSHGGHKEAGGFSILEKNIESFSKEFHKEAKSYFKGVDPKENLRVDLEIDFKNITIQLVKELEQLAPFGIGNPSPIFHSKGIEIKHIQIIGTNHIKMELQDKDTIRNAIGWRMLGHPLLEKGNFVNATYSLEINTYKGISSVQLIIKELTKD